MDSSYAINSSNSFLQSIIGNHPGYSAGVIILEFLIILVLSYIVYYYRSVTGKSSFQSWYAPQTGGNQACCESCLAKGDKDLSNTINNGEDANIYDKDEPTEENLVAAMNGNI